MFARRMRSSKLLFFFAFLLLFTSLVAKCVPVTSPTTTSSPNDVGYQDESDPNALDSDSANSTLLLNNNTANDSASEPFTYDSRPTKTITEPSVGTNITAQNVTRAIEKVDHANLVPASNTTEPVANVLLQPAPALTNSSSTTISSNQSHPLLYTKTDGNLARLANDSSVAETPQRVLRAPFDKHTAHNTSVTATISRSDNNTSPSKLTMADYDSPTYHNSSYFDSWDHDEYSSALPFLAQTDNIYTDASQREYGPASYEVRYKVVGDQDGHFDIPAHWGPYTPYHSNPMFATVQRNRNVPKKCTIKQVHLLHRHGARLPADKHDFVLWFEDVKSIRASEAGKKATFHGPLRFLETWSYRLGANIMTAAGSQQMFDSGIQAHYRYGALLATPIGGTHKPVVRTLSQQRMLSSAKMWSLGFYGTNASQFIDLEVQSTLQGGFNSTLQANEACPGSAFKKPGDYMLTKWVERYLERAVKRLQGYVKGGPKLTPFIVFGMQSLCAHETYGMGASEFCNLFTRKEWEGYAYAFDLSFQGNFGFMSPTGRALGIGWIQELAARLANTNIETPLTSQNSTLDGNRTTFPLDQQFYADFTHGRQIVAVLAALDLDVFATHLSAHHIEPSRNFLSGHIIPTAARLYVEVLECDEEEDVRSGDAHKHYVRFILNDALLPLSTKQGCDKGKGERDGMCPLGKFVEHVNKVLVPAANFTRACAATDSEGSPWSTAEDKKGSAKAEKSS